MKNQGGWNKRGLQHARREYVKVWLKSLMENTILDTKGINNKMDIWENKPRWEMGWSDNGPMRCNTYHLHTVQSTLPPPRRHFLSAFWKRYQQPKVNIKLWYSTKNGGRTVLLSCPTSFHSFLVSFVPLHSSSFLKFSPSWYWPQPRIHLYLDFSLYPHLLVFEHHHSTVWGKYN